MSQTSQVTKTTTTSVSSLASASSTSTSPGPIQSLSQRLSFSVEAGSGDHDPYIYDLKLLPGGLVLVADGNNECVKLFNSQTVVETFQLSQDENYKTRICISTPVPPARVLTEEPKAVVRQTDICRSNGSTSSIETREPFLSVRKGSQCHNGYNSYQRHHTIPSRGQGEEVRR
ncbi:hypothetical protein ElyMa_002529700 [Elysia marginata]|uniref:Uncharacterized protein n=1 Tax=Elysia marginata TaxID=1093978 RepID=A0AAV4GW91_9GAST|nr:hypothetical protein ElyMa_002529700 [Elysia marginata]